MEVAKITINEVQIRCPHCNSTKVSPANGLTWLNYELNQFFSSISQYFICDAFGCNKVFRLPSFMRNAVIGDK